MMNKAPRFLGHESDITTETAKTLQNARAIAMQNGGTSAFSEDGIAAAAVGDIKELLHQDDESDDGADAKNAKEDGGKADDTEADAPDGSQGSGTGSQWFEREESIGKEVRDLAKWTKQTITSLAATKKELGASLKLANAENWKSVKVEAEIARLRLNAIKLVTSIPKAVVSDTATEAGGAAADADAPPRSTDGALALGDSLLPTIGGRARLTAETVAEHVGAAAAAGQPRSSMLKMNI
jgi:hypothetical protein